MANQEAFSRSAASLLRIKTLALQKRPLFVLFALVGRTAAILDVAMLCTVEGAQCKTRHLLNLLYFDLKGEFAIISSSSIHC